MCGSNGIEATDAELHSQLLLQFFLQVAACNQRGGLTPRLQPAQHSRKHFGRMSMSAILQSGFSSGTSLLLPTVSGGPTCLDPGGRCRLQPGHTCFHQLKHLLFGCSSLLGFHPRSLLSLLKKLLSALPPLSYLI